MQIYLTADQRRRLEVRRAREGCSLAALVREAVDAYLAENDADVDTALAGTFGTLTSLEVPSRSEWERA